MLSAEFCALDFELGRENVWRSGFFDFCPCGFWRGGFELVAWQGDKFCTTERGPNAACKTLRFCADQIAKCSRIGAPTCIADEQNSKGFA
jgi:hypothetical protein